MRRLLMIIVSMTAMHLMYGCRGSLNSETSVTYAQGRRNSLNNLLKSSDFSVKEPLVKEPRSAGSLPTSSPSLQTSLKTDDQSAIKQKRQNEIRSAKMELPEGGGPEKQSLFAASRENTEPGIIPDSDWNQQPDVVVSQVEFHNDEDPFHRLKSVSADAVSLQAEVPRNRPVQQISFTDDVVTALPSLPLPRSQPELGITTDNQSLKEIVIEEMIPVIDQLEISDKIFEPIENSQSLSLIQVLDLADQRNPNVQIARERINEANARVNRAEVLILPSLRAGVSINHHFGNLQGAGGEVYKREKGGFYTGLGANGIGSGSPNVPGVLAQFHVTDAIFQPRITQHTAASRRHAAITIRNDVLRDSAVGYLELMRAEHALAIAVETRNNTQELVRITRNYAILGQGLVSDYERMLTELALRRADVIQRQEATRVTSAKLAQLLRSDPNRLLICGDLTVVPLTLIESHMSLNHLVQDGLARRPELAEARELVCEAVERLNRERYAPLVPSILLGMSYGQLAGGIGNHIGNANARLDMDAMAFWELRQFGFTDRYAREEMSSLVRQNRHRQLAVMDSVAREVVEAHSQVQERKRRIQVALAGIHAAERSMKLNADRIENAQGLPIESLQAVQALASARDAYLNAVVDFNVAQFHLCRATGWFEVPVFEVPILQNEMSIFGTEGGKSKVFAGSPLPEMKYD